MRPRLQRPVVLLVLALLGPYRTAAQELRLFGAPLARAAEGFTHVYDVAELPDGRVLLSDSRERVLAVVDLKAGSVQRIGSRGEGPREYQSVFSILRRADGSFGVYDSSLQRVTVVSASGEVVGTETFKRPALPGFSAPRGPDRNGRWYVDVRTLGQNGLNREAVVYRWEPWTARVDSVGVVMQYARGQGGPGIVPMPLGDAWSVLSDGSVARIVGEDYHVEWWAPDGRVVRGTPIPHRRVAADARAREAWVERLLAEPPAGAALSAPGGGAPTPTQVESRLRQFDRDRFPDRLPPFRPEYSPASPRGHVWLRLDAESEPNRTVFDVLDRSGRLAHRLAVDGTARVVGFGPDSVYLVRTDALGQEWLEKYAYPAG